MQTKFGGCLLSLKCRSGIEIQSEIMILILILNRISILKKLCGTTPNFVGILRTQSIQTVLFFDEN